MRCQIVFETTVEKMLDTISEYKDFMTGMFDKDAVDVDCVKAVFNFLENYGGVDTDANGILSLICHLSALDDCDVTVKVISEEDMPNRIIQINTFGVYWGLNISVESDCVFVFNGLYIPEEIF